MAELRGVHGRILRVNLTTGQASFEAVPEPLWTRYLGGRGMGAYYLWHEVPSEVDPLSPGNKLIFMAGPMLGSLAPGSNKVNVTFRSPLTRTYSYSLCGGFWGPELKFTGVDGLIVEGKADHPVYLFIDNDRVVIKDARHLWGKTIPETSEMIKEELGDPYVKVACIGPAGEKLNRMACITADLYREFGRGGAGAVMGSKNLKAIAVRGTKDLTVARPGRLAKYVQDLYAGFKTHPKAYARRWYGTVEMLETVNSLGFWSTHNFNEGYFPPGGNMTGPRMREDIVVRDTSCYACPVGCGKVSAVEVPGVGKVCLEGPEFETVGLLGPNCGVSDWATLLQATRICDHNGLDTISAGALISFAMECYEKGIITKEDTGGLELKFGNGEAMLALLEQVVKREGIGDILAEGLKYAGNRLGAPDLAIHSKGMAPATYDPRGAKGMALTYATSPKGAHHMVSPCMAAAEPFNEAGKAAVMKEIQLAMALVDSLGFCSTMRFVLSVDRQLDLFQLVTGVELTKEEFLTAAERIVQLERRYNTRAGFDRRDDTLPKRFLQEAMTAGPSAGQTINLDVMLEEYYALMGWDQNGVPTAETVARFELP